MPANANVITPKEFLEAAKNGDLEAVKRYIALNGNDSAAMNVVNDFGCSALMLASDHRHLAVVHELLKVPELNVRRADKDGNTALHYALFFGDNTTLPIVEELLKSSQMNRDCINATNCDKDTALIMAARDGNRPVVDLLLEYRARFNIKNNKSRTAEIEAFLNGHKEIAELLSAKDKFVCFDKLPKQMQSEIIKYFSINDLNQSLISRKHVALFKPKLDQHALLPLVVRGEYDKVRALLKHNIKALSERVKVTDCSGRTFENISGFEYALWALDKHMWTTMLNCLPPKNKKSREILEELYAQYQQVKANGIVYSLNNQVRIENHFNFGTYIYQLSSRPVKHIPYIPEDIGYEKQFNEAYIASKRAYKEAKMSWGIELGGAQKLLPMHVVHEYCSKKSFKTLPDFTKKPVLPHSNQFYNIKTREFENWFKPGSELGVTNAYVTKGISQHALSQYGVPYFDMELLMDRNAIIKLYDVRTKDFINLDQQFEAKFAASRNPGSQLNKCSTM